MLTRFYESASYVPLYRYPDLQAYRKGRFTGWIRQPAKIGPVLFTNSSQTYFNLKPVSASSSGGGLGTGGVIGIVVAALVVLGGVGFMLVRRRSVEERE